MSAQVVGTIKMGEVHNVVAEQDGWGQLENGSWIKLDFTVPHKREETIEISENSKVLENSEILESSVTDTNVVEEQSEVVVDTIISTTDVPGNPPLHKVKKKESLWDIAELWYGVGNGERYIEIEEFNNLKSDILRAGMVLKIPNV